MSPEQQQQIQQALADGKQKLGKNYGNLMALCAADQGKPLTAFLKPEHAMEQLQCMSKAQHCEEVCKQANGGSFISKGCAESTIASLPMGGDQMMKVTCQHLAMAQNGAELFASGAYGPEVLGPIKAQLDQVLGMLR